MASLKSSRSQCCCCAVGVFAALFGIIMLSAGICIVINVNYMEVDTSGLPSELHNDDGKKVVGIILICVALCALGLSATVSIIFFAVCNRMPRRMAVNGNASAVGNGAENSGSRSQSNSQNSRSSSHASQQRSSDASRNTTDSQPSLNSLPKQRRPSPSITPATRGVRGKKNSKSVTHRKRHPRYQTGLPPHIEEPETAKSQVDLKLHQSKSADIPSGSQSPVLHGFSTTSHTVDETQGMASTSFSDPPKPGGKLPLIFINGTSTAYPNAANSSGSAITADSFNQSVDSQNPGESLMLTEESTLYDEVETDESTTHVQSLITQQPENSDNGEKGIDQTQSNISHMNVSEHDSEPNHSQNGSPSPKLSMSSSTDCASQEEKQSSIDSFTQNVVKSPPTKDGDLVCSPQTLASNKSSNSQGVHSTELPPSSRHHKMYEGLNDNGSDKKCESQSSVNSAFTNDGGDPDDEDMKRMHEKMK